MTNYMVLFQIGPVQEFIRAARKTQDYWAGSFLLSHLNCIAMQTLGKQNIVFPDLQDSEFYENALKDETFWKGVTDPADYIPSVPNRFFGIVDNDPQGKLQAAKDAVLKKWQEIAAAVHGHLKTKIIGLTIDSSLWDGQITNRALEILYVWRQWPEGEDYGAAYQATEALMGARKASRLFPALDPQVGYACSLCGLRVALGSNQVKSREVLRTWWQEKIQNALTYRIRKGEYLCAVCLVKRLYPEVVFSREKDVPSTATMATISWQNKLQGLLRHPGLEQTAHSRLIKAMQDFRIEVQKAAKKLGEPEEAALPPYFDYLKIPADQQLKIEGDWLLEDSYNRKERREKVQKALASLKSLKETISELVKKVNAAAPLTPIQIGSPAKYLALITADGDSMGAFLADCDEAKHQTISQRLQTFATKAMPQVLERERPGFILYWGGDEGLAMVSLADLLPALMALRKQWEEVVRQAEPQIPNMPTLSAGAVIFHHQYPLRQAIAEVFQTLEQAKELRTYKREKDAWAVQILKRSGAPLLTRAHWHYEYPAINPLEVLKEFINVYQDEKLSPRWLALLQAEERVLGDRPEDWDLSKKKSWWDSAKTLFDHEVTRLLHRQAAKQWDPAPLVKKVQDLNAAISGLSPHHNFRRYQDLKGMLHLSHYIAKGGGR